MSIHGELLIFAHFRPISKMLKITENTQKIAQKCTKIKTLPWIDILLFRFCWFWRRLKAEIVSFQTTLKSSKSKQYSVDSWPCFNFHTFSTDFKNVKNRKNCTKKRTKMHQNQNMAMDRPYIAPNLMILAPFESWRSQLLNGAKLVKIRSV